MKSMQEVADWWREAGQANGLGGVHTVQIHTTCRDVFKYMYVHCELTEGGFLYQS